MEILDEGCNVPSLTSLHLQLGPHPCTKKQLGLLNRGWLGECERHYHSSPRAHALHSQNNCKSTIVMDLHVLQLPMMQCR